MYKIMLGMSYYIHGRGLGALVDVARPDFKGLARPAGHPLPLGSNLWRKIGSVPEEPKRDCLLNSYMLEWISALADLCGANLNILFTRQS